MTERKVLHCSPDIYLGGRTLYACLWYPKVEGPGGIDAVEVELIDVRAARGIRITYDYTRDGYCISAEKFVGEEGDQEQTWVEEAFIPSHEEEPEPPVVGFTVTETIELGNYGSPGMNPEAIRQLDVKDPSKLFNEPLTIPVEDEKGNVHIFEGCYVKSVEYNYPADGPLVAEPQTVFYGRVGSNVVPGPEVLGQEEYDRRQVDTVMQAVRKLSTRRLMWVVDENKLKDERLLDPGVVCWVGFAQAELQRRRDARKRGRPDDWVSDTE